MRQSLGLTWCARIYIFAVAKNAYVLFETYKGFISDLGSGGFLEVSARFQAVPDGSGWIPGGARWVPDGSRRYLEVPAGPPQTRSAKSQKGFLYEKVS